MREEMSSLRRWLCPTELDRARVIDNSRRVRRARLVGAAAIGIALIALMPWYGWWVLALFAAVAANLLTLDRRMSRTDRPEYTVAASLLFTEAVIGLGVALSGAAHSPALPWMAVPVGMTAARFRLRVVLVGAGIGLLMMLAVTLGVDPGSIAHRPALFMVSVALLVNVVAVAAALQDAELNYRSESVLDPLTGVLNRKSLELRFAELQQQARLTNGSVCVIAIDLDGFKQVNDRHGHSRGDAALRDAAYEMRKALRNFELIYRVGGEEFIVVLPGVDLAGGAQVAERLRAAVAREPIAGLEITVSLGVTAAGGAAVEYRRLFETADAALYTAKELGKNRVFALAPDDHHGNGRDHRGELRAVQEPGPAKAPRAMAR
ncbi:MAG TPA: GGDEF domain-containing protein [Solirubrobacterales bacterium]|nr:GGDEF domain-containing protein [Solirubrobacterales bacterium]